MARYSYVQINGKLYDKSLPLPEEACSRSTNLGIIPDTPDFVSPLDGTVVSGRRGIRDHCARHNVVPTQDLAGLPPRTAVSEYKVSAKERFETKQYMSYLIDQSKRK